MSRHRVTNRTHSKYSTHSVRSNLQKSLIGPSFVEAERTENRKYIYILDTVRVKWPSSSHTLSIEFHASWTHLSSTKPKIHSPAFEDSLCGFVYVSVFPPSLGERKNKTKNFIVMVLSSHNELHIP